MIDINQRTDDIELSCDNCLCYRYYEEINVDPIDIPFLHTEKRIIEEAKFDGWLSNYEEEHFCGKECFNEYNKTQQT